MYEVYCHTSPSGKRYVGWTSRGWRTRWRQHMYDARRGVRSAFYNAVRKYGARAFAHEVLCVVYSEDHAKRLECALIVGLQCRTPRGYNSTDGGDGCTGLTHSVETRARLSATKRGVPQNLTEAQRDRLRRVMVGNARALGFRQSESTKAKRMAYWTADRRAAAAVRMGVPHSPLTRGRMSASQKDRWVTRSRVLSDAHKAALKEAWVLRRARMQARV